VNSLKARLLLAASLLMTASFVNAEGSKIPECQAPFEACKAAGYKVGAHKKGDKEGADMGLWVDCIHAVADGKKQVPGVDPAAAQACKAAKKAKRKSK
jgi:hypothetical protein